MSALAAFLGLPLEASDLGALAALAAATLVSEDLTCIGAGVLVARGEIGFGTATLACLVGIFGGDMLLFLAGRILGRAAVSHAPLCWFLTPDDVERCSRWFSERGPAVIFVSRFVPGTRLPTYFAAGLLDTSAARLSLWFLLACAVWTPLLVGLSAALGASAIESALFGLERSALGLAAFAVALLALSKAVRSLATYRGRRLLVGRFRRIARWEFWPPWAFYPPIVCYVAWLALRHRSLSVFADANPAIREGGFVGESKSAILGALARRSPDAVARFELVEAALAPEERIARARRFMEREGLRLPVAIKPDVGQRGSGVRIVRTDETLEEHLGSATVDQVVQEYVGGAEFGVFYFRRPGESKGRIFSITEKRFPSVAGDGRSTLERLVLADERAVCMARAYFDANRARIWDVPAEGELVELVEIGSHCRGAVFLDGAWARTAALEEAIDRVSRGFDGFYFGRYDVRAPSTEEFLAGHGFKVIELNGVTSEATNVYDPSYSLLDAYRVMFAQWRLAFEIGAANRARGARATRTAALALSALAFARGRG